MNIFSLHIFSLIILISFFNVGESAVADIDQVLDAADNPKNYRTIFQIARGAQKRYRDLEQIFLRLERILIQDRNNDPTLQPRAEIAIEELRNIWLSLKPLMAISDLTFTKSTKVSSIASQRTSANNARTSLQVNIADSTFGDLEFAYKRWRQFFLENDLKNSPNRDERRAYAALNRNFALLIPLVRDHQSKGADEVQRILDAPNSQEILFDPNQPMDTGSKLLELEKNFARSKAFTDQTKYKVTLDATTSPTADNAQKADESLDAAYSILMANEIKALGANQKDSSKLAKAIFETFFLRLRDENKYTLAEIRRANDEMGATIGQNGRRDEKAEMVIREAYFRAKLDASDFFDPSVNNPALGQFQNTLSKFIDQIFNLLNFDLAKDYAQILEFQPGDDVEAKFKAKDAEFRQIRKEIRDFRINDQRAFVDLVTDCLDAIENARDKLAAQFPSPPNTGGTGTGSGMGGAGGRGSGTGGSSNPSNPASQPQPSSPAQPWPPMPTPQPSSPPTGTGISPVVDKATNCQQIKRLCNNRLYEGLMKTHCAKTCQDAGVQCADSRPNCGTWRRNGFCISAFYKDETKKELCSLTCGLC